MCFQNKKLGTEILLQKQNYFNFKKSLNLFINKNFKAIIMYLKHIIESFINLVIFKNAVIGEQHKKY